MCYGSEKKNTVYSLQSEDPESVCALWLYPCSILGIVSGMYQISPLQLHEKETGSMETTTQVYSATAGC